MQVRSHNRRGMPGTMKISTMKTENEKVTCETTEGTVVHININQRSAFDCLLDTFRFCREMKKSEQKTESPRVSRPGAHLGFGVAFISLGLISVMLAIMIAILQPNWGIFYSGVHFWVGFPFIVSGILNILTYKYPKAFWMALSFASLIVNFGVSIAGIVVAANDVNRLGWMLYSEDICSNVRNSRRDYYYEPTRNPRYDDRYDYSMERCKSEFQRFKAFQTGLIILTLLMMIWGLCLAIVSVGYRVKTCCRSCTLKKTKEEDDAMIKPNPSDDIIIA